MSGSEERRPSEVEFGEVGRLGVVDASSSGLRRAQGKAPKRSVQTKLNFFKPLEGRMCGGGGSDEEGEGDSSSSGTERRRPKRKKKAPSSIQTKVTVIRKEDLSFNSRSIKHHSCSDFFLKISEKRLRQKDQKVEEDIVDLTAEDDSCKEIQTLGKKNSLLCTESTNPKQVKTRSQLRTGKESAVEGSVAHEIRECRPMMDTSLESKYMVEGNVHASAARSVHPFFSHWKTTKAISDFSQICKVSKNYLSDMGDDGLFSCPPVHVFETLQDKSILVDWGRWKISKSSSLELSNSIDAVENKFQYADDVLVPPLKFDGSVPFLNHNEGAIHDGNSHVVHPGERFVNMFQDPKSISLPSKSTPMDSQETEQQYAPSQETSLYKTHHDLPNSSLWSNKYRPEKAVEVCGNTKSVRLLSEWLDSWQERQSLAVKDSTSNRCINEDSDGSLFQNVSDSEDEDEVLLENVLLISGPVGSGKSAAIYACAKEQGFQIIEVNASDERNGTHIKHKFGEAVDSHAIELCSTQNVADSRKQDLLLMMSSSVDTREHKNGKLKVASSLNKVRGCETAGNQSSTCRVANKNLFLFEDVDVVLDEDRGFITTIMQLAETSRRPIILTTNSKSPPLPQVLNRLVIAFTHPSTEELLNHMLTICIAEGVQASPLLVERVIRVCRGDIRKTLLLLQFWCQSQRGQQGEQFQCTYSPLLFDLDAAHWAITKITPCAIPCNLALKIEEELAKAISNDNDKVALPQFKEEDMVEPTDSLSMGKNQCPIFQVAEFASPSKGHDSDDSHSPLTFSRRRLKHRTDNVFSSESEELLVPDATICAGSPIASSTPPGACDRRNESFDVPFQEYVDLPRGAFITTEVASTSHVCDSYMSRCTHDLSIVPETEVSNRQGHLSTTSTHLSASLHDCLIGNVGSIQSLSQDEIDDANETILATYKEPFGEFTNMHEIYTESVHGNEDLALSVKEAGVDSSRECHLLDECSRADFGLEFMPVDRFVSHTASSSVEETWKRLHDCHEDLRSHVTSFQRAAMKILDLTCGLTDLISQTDILLKRCLSLTNDIFEPSSFLFDEQSSSSWCDELLVIASTLAQHGFCFYARKAAIDQSSLGCEVPVFLAHEMLAASSSSMALGKLLSQKKMTNNGLRPEGGLKIESSKYEFPLGRVLGSELRDSLHSFFPERLYTVLKGPAFHEYVSFLGCMSKSENSRLSHNKDQCQRRHRRVRDSRHYLRSLPFSLSTEDVDLLAARSCFGQVGAPDELGSLHQGVASDRLTV